jgi:hypothetical protein
MRSVVGVPALEVVTPQPALDSLAEPEARRVTARMASHRAAAGQLALT